MNYNQQNADQNTDNQIIDGSQGDRTQLNEYKEL